MHTFLTVFFCILTLVISLGYIAMWTSIVGKTGRSRWVGMIMFIPGVSLVYLIVLAVTDWPIEVELRRCKQELRDLKGPPAPAGKSIP